MPTADETHKSSYVTKTKTIRAWSDMMLKNGHKMTKDELAEALREMENLTLSLRIMLNRGNLDNILHRPNTRDC